MAMQSRPGAEVPGGTLELLPLAFARPGEALRRARAILAIDPDPYDASVAHQAAGIVLRDFGDVSSGIRELRIALRLARLIDSRDRQADVLATLGVALTKAGRTAPGLAALDEAVSIAAGPMTGRVLHRRGNALRIVGQHREALEDLRRAVAILHAAGDTIWEARALTASGLAELAINATGRADADLAVAESLFAATSQELERAYARHNRGLVAFRSGDLPLALAHLGEAGQIYRTLAVLEPELSVDRCAVLLAASLSADALREADAAISDIEKSRGQPTIVAELQLTAAGAALACADPLTALARARAARRLFRAQRRPWWLAHATFMMLQARHAGGEASAGLLRQAEQAASSLDALGSGDATRARLLAGRMALALGRMPDAQRHLTAAARTRMRKGPASARADGWLAEGLLAEATANPRRMLSACRRGFDLIDQHLLTLGGTELRARATAAGAEFAVLAQRHAVRAGRPRLLLEWSERWRATALAAPPVRPVDDAELQADLTAVRDVAQRLDQARAAGKPAASLVREQLRLETAVRERAMQTRGTGHTDNWDFSITQLLTELGTARLVQIVEIDGDLHLLVCGGGKVRQFTAGRLADAAREIDYARFGLSRLAHGRPAGRHPAGRRPPGRAPGQDLGRAPGQAAGRPANALAVLEQTGRRLQDALLGTAAIRHLGSGPVIIVPPGRLHAVPWALLPALRDRVLSVAPSARAWLRARTAVPPDHRDLVLVRGPGLGPGSSEIPALAADSLGGAMNNGGLAREGGAHVLGDTTALLPGDTAAHVPGDAAAFTDSTALNGSGIALDGATVLADGTATAARVLAAIDGAWLVHIAAHGTFRADSPLFSSLRMDDGPLTVHDFERLRRAPYRLILPCCDSGLLAPAGADELLGLTSTLVPLGTAGIVAAVGPVNDKAAACLMLRLHRGLRDGHTLSEALRDARRDLGNDPVQIATGLSFIALGAG
jgi:tetratricopeptide (TPR) repeat protein